jgi:AcrR family transcriptional regulator
MASDRPYHHGALRESVIAAAVAEVQAVGASAVSMREIARRAGVSHAAPTHHFGDKAGIFTAIATQGFEMAYGVIAPAVEGPYGFLDGGVAYIGFALAHPGHFEVMYRPSLYHEDDPDLTRARDDAFGLLFGSAGALAERHGEEDVTGLVAAGWALSHGLATLWLSGNLDRHLPNGTEGIAEHLQHGLIALGRITAKRVKNSRPR